MSFRRRRLPEVMDQTDLDANLHVEALRALAYINFFSHSAGILWPPLAELARTMAPRVPRILDIATGGGDVPIRLFRRAQRTGLALHLEGCDMSPVAVEHACARAAGTPIRFFVYNALTGPALGGYDAIMCSLFLHHLDETHAISLLVRMAEMAGQLVLVNDLQRGAIGLLAAHLVTRLMTRSPVVRIDGPRSVEAAFTAVEARALAQRAGLRDARVSRRWPFRWLLTWRRP